MALYNPLRLGPRFYLPGMSTWIDLLAELDIEPQQERALISQLSSVGGRVQTLHRGLQDTLRLRCSSLDYEDAKKLQQAFRRLLAHGHAIEICRDRGYCFHLAGDRYIHGIGPIEEMGGAKPFGANNLVTPVNRGGQYGLGSFAVHIADPPGSSTRTNLVEDGDFRDGTLESTLNGSTNLWTLSATLGGFPTEDFSPGIDPYTGKLARSARFYMISTGTKTADLAVDLDGFQADSTPVGAIALSFRYRAGRDVNTGVSNVMTVDFIETGSSSSITDGSFSINPTNEWQTKFHKFGVSTSDTNTNCRLRLTFTNDLAYAPIQISELQAEFRNHWTPFIPYSTIRSLTGSRVKGICRFRNRMHYMHQAPIRKAGDRWGFTASLWTTPFWGTDPNGITIKTGGNDKLDFTYPTGVTAYAATLNEGCYEGEHLAIEVARAMNATAASGFTCTWNQATGFFTIANGSNNFDLDFSTGPNSATSCHSLLGYDSTDRTNVASDVSENIVAHTFNLFTDGDANNSAALNAFNIYMTSATTTETIGILCYADDGTAVQLTDTSTNLVAGTPVHIAISWQDSSDGVASDGSLDLYVNGTQVQTTSHAKFGANMGLVLYVGQRPDGVAQANNGFSNVRLDPVFIDGTTYVIGDYYDATNPPNRDRNHWRAKISRQGRPLVTFDDRNNSFNLDAVLIEDRAA